LEPRLEFLPYDNPVTRYLNGRAGWEIPPAHLTAAHFEVAAKALSRFAVVVRLAEFASDASQFSASFGWPLERVLAELLHSTTSAKGATDGTATAVQGKHTDHSISLTAVDDHFLRKLNVWDVKLFAHACELAAVRTRSATHTADMNVTVSAATHAKPRAGRVGRALSSTMVTPAATRRGATEGGSVAAPVDVVRVIWIAWFDGGEESMPEIGTRCLASWRRNNPGWTVNVLSNRTLKDHVDAEALARMSKWQSLTTRSDVLRIYLLGRHGGLWVDATCFCTKRLDDWLWGSLVHRHFVIWDPMPGMAPVLNFAYSATPSAAFRAAFDNMPDVQLYGCCNKAPAQELYACEKQKPGRGCHVRPNMLNGVVQLYHSSYTRILSWALDNIFTGTMTVTYANGRTGPGLPGQEHYLAVQCPPHMVVPGIGSHRAPHLVSGTKLISTPIADKREWIRQRWNATADPSFLQAVAACPFQKLSTKVLALGVQGYEQTHPPIVDLFPNSSKLMSILNFLPK
jgi:hypothetical protein